MDLEMLVTLFGEEEALEEWPKFCGKAPRQEVDLLYVYGFSPYMEPLLDWLREKKSRDIVVIEDDMRAVKKLQDEGLGDFLEERLHLKILFRGASLESFCGEIAEEFPYPVIDFVNLKEEKGRFEEIRLALLRKTTLENAVLNEMLYYHKLFPNIRSNVYRIPDSFDVAGWKDAFKGVPAIICGAGPSLASVKGKLKEMEDRALILAGGSTITALGAMDITPHLAFAIDPNSEEFTRLAFHTAYETPLIYGTRVEPNVFRTHVGPTGYFSTGTGGGIEKWLEEKLGIVDAKIFKEVGEEAMSVTALALMTAIYIGADPIILVGIDLAFSGGRRYAPGVISDLQCSLEEEATKVGEVPFEQSGKTTVTKWIMEADVIDRVASRHPHRLWLDGTGQGLGFSYIPYTPNFENECPMIHDLRGKVYEMVWKTRFDLSSRDISENLNHLLESFERVDHLIEEIQKEGDSPKAMVLEMDLEEEPAFQVALKPAVYAIGVELRKERLSTSETREALYRKMKSLVADYLKNLIP